MPGIKHVWIVTHGENGEGGNVVGVFHRKPSADRVTSLRKPAVSGVWEPVSWQEGRWENSCDFLVLARHKVQT